MGVQSQDVPFGQTRFDRARMLEEVLEQHAPVAPPPVRDLPVWVPVPVLVAVALEAPLGA